MHGLWCAFIYSFICSLINSVIHWFIHTLDIPLFLDERVPKRTNRCILFEDTYFMYFSTRYLNLWSKMAKLVRIPYRNGPEWAFFCFFSISSPFLYPFSFKVMAMKWKLKRNHKTHYSCHHKWFSIRRRQFELIWAWCRTQLPQCSGMFQRKMTICT